MVDKPDTQAMQPKITVDACGLCCPMPLLKAKQALNQVDKNEVIELLADDPASMKDMTRFAQLSVHVLLLAEQEQEQGVYRYHLQKQ